MTKKLTFLGGIFLAVIASFLPFQQAFAIGSMSVTGGSVNNGSNITVSVTGSGSGIWGGAMTLAYDSSALQFVSASNGGALTQQTAPQQQGSTVIADWYSTSATNGGTLAVVTFKALRGSGTTSLTLSASGDYASRLLNSDGNAGAGTSLGGSTITFTTPAPPAPTNPTTTPPPTTSNPSSAPKTSTPKTSNPSTPSTTSPDTSTPSTPSAETPSEETVADDSNIIASIKIGFFDKNHKPLKKKKVTLHSDPQTATTDDKGYATFTNVPVGSHKAEYTEGKKTYSQTLMLADGNTRTVVYQFTQFSFPVWGWILGALVVVAGAVATFLMMRNRPKTAAQQVSVYAAMPAPAGSLGSNTPLPPSSSDAGIQSRLDQIRPNDTPQIGTVIEPDGTKRFPEDR